MRCTDRLRDERGMTLIELMIAAVVCAVGIMATIAVLDTSREVSVKAEFRETMSHQAQREIERLMELPWSELAHQTAPSASSTAGDPASHVSDGRYAYDRKNPTVTEPFVLESTGLVDHVPTAWTDGQTRLGGRVHRFVTRVSANARRITVVVTGAATGAKPPAHVLVSSIKTVPNLS
jgi:prepilin-type N-terminal cleavage/methylation domain-containing protein